MYRQVAWAVCHLLLCCSLGVAQQSPKPAAPKPAAKPVAKPVKPTSPSVGQVREAQPPLYFLKDQDGKLQAVPGFKLEDFEELYNLKHQLGKRDQTPRYSLQQMSAVGSVTDDHAKLTVKFQILVHGDGWVRVPLRLGRAVLSERVQYKGSGQQFLRYETKGEGYVAWLRGKPGGQHDLTLKLLVPLTRAGDESRLQFQAPHATTSELKLTVPVPGATARVSEGATLLPPKLAASKLAAGKSTELTVLGLAGDFELGWRKSDHPAVETSTVLEVVGAVLVKIDSRSITSEATLTVRGYGAPLDKFRVRLPKAAELLGDSPSGYTVVPVSTTDPAAADKRIVEIRFSEKTFGPVEVRLAMRLPYEVGKPGEWLELAGFELEGAARQSGHIAVVVSGDWRVLWGPSHGVRQVDEVPEPLRHESLVAGFEYLGRRHSLTARVVPRKTRITVEPEYLLLVQADRVRLEAKLKYTVRGAKAFSLDVDLAGWQFDEVGPDNLVAVDGVAVDESKVLSVPLLQPSTGQMELTIKAHQEIAPDAKSLSLSLPRPRASSPGPAIVVVLADDNVELTPDAEATKGLVRQQVAPRIQLPERQQDPLFYRGEASRASFAAGYRTHTQTVFVDVTTRIDLDRNAGEIRQNLAYKIAYEPVDKLIIDVPWELANSDDFEVVFDGRGLVPVALPGRSNGEDGAERVKMRVALPAARIGLCELSIRYSLSPERLLPKQSIIRTIPLVMPAEGELTSNKLYVTAPVAIGVHHRGGPWTIQEGNSGWLARRGGLPLSAPKRADHVVLAVQLQDREGLASTIVQRCWVQTWLSQTARQDRAVFQFTSDQKEIELIVPTGVALGEVELLLDGKRVPARITPESHLVVPIADEANHRGANHREHLLEMSYHFPGVRPPRGRMSLEIVRLGREAWVRRMYWQLVLPRDEHVVSGPAGFTHEFAWGWNGIFWGRNPLLEQRQLETWSGSPHRTSVPQGTNNYLFGSLGSVGRCEIRTLSRSWIVLGASGVALIAGLLLIYVPISRHPATLFAVAVLLLCMGTLYPEPILLVSQAASLGLALTLLAGLLQRSVLQRRRGRVLEEISISGLHRDSTQTQLPPGGVGNQASTQAAPSPVPSTASHE